MHWSYDEIANQNSDLDQGDILSPTADLKSVLNRVHQHFCDDKYLAFLVATQSCDLVRRGSRVPPKGRYISITVVRSLTSVLPALLDEVARSVAPGVFRTSARAEARRFLERLFDQNEQALGLFYLHPDADVGLGQASVAMLRIKVALKVEHYETLVAARRGRLQSEFRGKLGWLLGNLYSRAASPDWADVEGGKDQVKRLVDAHLREQIEGVGPTWVDDEVIDAARVAGFDFSETTNLTARLEGHRPKRPMDQFVEQVRIEGSKIGIEDEKLTTLCNRLKNNPVLTRLTKAKVAP